MRKKQNIFFFVLWIGLIILLRYNNMNMPLERDEGEYAYGAWLLLSGKGFPYMDTFLQKPPLIIVMYLLAQLIHSTVLWPARLLSVLSISVSAIATGLAAKRIFNKDN